MKLTIIDRVQALGWPAGQFVVIAGGVLDALGLREAHDVDVVVTKLLYEQLMSEGWEVSEKHGEQYLVNGEVEAWLTWDGPDGPWYFDDLKKQAVEIDEVLFCPPEMVLEWKKRHHRPKDAADIQLLEEYVYGKK